MLSAKELASVLEMDPDTLRNHIKNGDITGELKGPARFGDTGFSLSPTLQSIFVDRTPSTQVIRTPLGCWSAGRLRIGSLGVKI
jgi:hypothetical protein